MNDNALSLLQVELKKMGSKTPISPQAVAMCRILDHYHYLWLHDRDRYHERLQKLEGKK